MHTDIDYSCYSPEMAEQKALNDLREYLGEAQYTRLVKQVSRWPDTDDSATHIRTALGMVAGVEGYPVEVFIKRYLHKQ